MVPAQESALPALYNLPDYYDIAFTYDRDISGEIDFLRNCFRDHSAIEVKTILEPACGSGMFLVGFARRGYRITGYDLSRNMVEYAGDLIAREGLEDRADAVEGDMRSIRFDRTFDAALTLISSLSYCVSDDGLENHFRIMSDTVRSGGLYIVEIFFACNDLTYEQYPYETWTVEQDNLKIDVSWKIHSYDREQKIRSVVLNMGILDNGTPLSFEEKHRLRLWYEADFRAFCAMGGFDVEAVYDQKFRAVSPGTPLTGELGALYCVLKKR
jgi:SAM-dependent methyltransferase